MPTYDEIKDDLRHLWDTAELRPERAARAHAAAEKVLAGKAHYEQVAGPLGVPWAFVGVVHLRESDCSFSRHLHNGDRLTARTVHVPAGRPIAPPKNGAAYTWEESAIDALRQKGLHNVKGWCIERILYELERFNGFGYRTYHPSVKSPYLWADTTLYHGGKYVADGQFSSSAFDPQPGAADVLRILIDEGHFSIEEPSVDEANQAGKATGGETETETPRPPLSQRSRKYWWTRWQEKIYAAMAAAAIAVKGRAEEMWNDPLGALDVLKVYVERYGVELVIAIGVGGYVAWRIMKIWQVQDIEAGRSIPSGDA